MSTTPVAGLKVLDLSKVLAGPLCAQYLGDMGADVIKVEAHEGDETRGWPPFRRTPEGDSATGAVFISANRNKRGIAIDLRTAGGRAVVRRLAAEADVVIASFGPGVAERLGVDAAQLRELNPRLVYCSISGFGSVGPMSGAKGYDVVLQAFCGMMAITGQPGGGPVRSPFSPVDQATGLHALIGILAALFERSSTGVGALVEASLFDSATGFLGYFLQSYWESGKEPQRVGAGHQSLCPYDVFEAADGPMILGVANDSLWRAFCTIAGVEHLAHDPRLRTNGDRVAHRAETVALVGELLSSRTCEDWIARLADAGIPCAPLNSLGQFSKHPHTLASGMLSEIEHPRLGKLTMVGQPLRFDGERPQVRRPPPLAGENGREILEESGFSASEIAELARSGAIRLDA